MSSPVDGPLAGRTVAVTAARKVAEQTALWERRGARVVHAPVLGPAPYEVDDAALGERTEEVLAGPVDLFVATTGVGVRLWFDHAEGWGLLDRLLAALQDAEVLARGAKTVGALRARGLRESFVPQSEDVEGLLAHLLAGDLAGRRVVVQEYGEPLTEATATLRAAGADVVPVVVYRIGAVERPDAVRELVGLVADRAVDAVTFTSAMSVEAFLEAAAEAGRRDEVVAALRSDVVAGCVGHVTAAALEPWGVSGAYPERSRLAAMVEHLEQVLVARAAR